MKKGNRPQARTNGRAAMDEEARFYLEVLGFNF